MSVKAKRTGLAKSSTAAPPSARLVRCAHTTLGAGGMTTAVLSELEAKVAQHCDTVTWATTGIFVLSIFLSILRPDPTLTICLFGFYGV